MVAKGRHKFTEGEIEQIRELLGRVRATEPPQQESLRGQLRGLNFYVTDWDQSGSGFTVEDFDDLVARGLNTIDGAFQGGSKPVEDVEPAQVEWLKVLLEETSEYSEVRERQSSDPFGAELLFDGWVTIQRIALGKSGNRLAMCSWPGELKDQAEVFYSGDRVDRLLAFLDVHGEWRATPKPHLAFPFAKVPEILYLSPSLDAYNYLRRWTEPDAFDQIGAHAPDTVLSQLWRWLLEQGLTDEGPAKDGSLDAYLERVARRQSALMRPGLELRREWDWAEIKGAGREALVGELRETMREVLDALQEQGLPAR
jgi:hypothetical protein